MRLKRLLFLCTLALWMLAHVQRVDATAHQCTATGVIEQENFHPQLDGRWCSTTQFEARDICNQEGPTRCSIDCNICGGTATTWNCSFQDSGQAGDSFAVNAGCNISQFGHKYTLTCGCNYPPPPSCEEQWGYDPQAVCEVCHGGGWDEWSQMCYYSPILINLENNGNDQLTSAAGGVLFDFAGSGAPVQMAWPAADAPVAFLTLDRNHNGTIDNGAELFGNATHKTDGSLAHNGFEALVDLDQNHDGRIDTSDAVYQQLQLWLDSNHDGVSQSAELLSLPQAGITAILTDYRTRRHTDQNGNWYRYEGNAIMLRRGKEHTRRIFDVFLTSE